MHVAKASFIKLQIAVVLHQISAKESDTKLPKKQQIPIVVTNGEDTHSSRRSPFKNFKRVFCEPPIMSVQKKGDSPKKNKETFIHGQWHRS
jgi:hypothetical protein